MFRDKHRISRRALQGVLWLLIACLFAMLASCIVDPESKRIQCKADSYCPPGSMCIAEHCEFLDGGTGGDSGIVK